MKIATLIARILVGLVYVVFGLNYFLKFIPVPEELPEGVADYMKVMDGTGYLKVVKVLEIIGGLMLLSGLFAVVGIAILLPISINILLFDLLIAKTPGLGIPLTALCIFLILGYWRNTIGVFSVYPTVGRSKPSA